MSYTVPYSFVPGTKARAQEVNANFAAVLNSFEEIDGNKVNLDLSNITPGGLEVIKNNSSVRNIGELIFSPVPLTDSNLHLLDGSLISGSGIYSGFVNYISEKYYLNTTFNSDIFSFAGTPTVTSEGIVTFSDSSNYVQLDYNFSQNHVFEIEYSGNNSTLSAATKPLNNAYQVYLHPSYANTFKIHLGTGSSFVVAEIQNSLFTTDYTIHLTITKSGLTYTVDYVINETVTGTITKTFDSIPTSSALQQLKFIGSDNQHNVNLKTLTIAENGTVVISGENICNYFTDEITWQNSVTTYGECGKFVYDSVGNTVRLPKIKGLIEYTTSQNEAGNLTEAGLPNITGNYKDSTGRIGNYTSRSGALSYKTGTTNNFGDGANSSTHVTEINFDASRSSSIYGNSSTVQPQTIKYLVYIVVASTPKTDIQVNIDNIVTDLNGKLDRDLTNISGTNIKNFDGQWVYKHSVINNNVNLSTGKYDVDLSAYLPADQNKYEVIVNIYGAQNSSSSSSFVILSSGLITESGTTLSYSNFAVNSNSTVQGMQTSIPVGLNRVLSYRIGGTNFDSLYIRLYGYRRIGSNS